MSWLVLIGLAVWIALVWLLAADEVRREDVEHETQVRLTRRLAEQAKRRRAETQVGRDA